MVLVGLGLLIASISFICYRHPPASWWPLLERLRTGIRDEKKRKDDAPTITLGDGDGGEGDVRIKEKGDIPMFATKDKQEQKEDSKESASTTSRQINPPSVNTPTSRTTTSHNSVPQIPNPPPSKAALDRAAMPPPPLFKKPTPASPPTPHASSQNPASSIPSFNLDTSTSEPQAPSFPALNSAQRASGGVTGPPRLGAPSQLPTPPSNRSLPLPNRSPIPSRPPTNSLFPPPTHTAPPSKPSKKVLLQPNHSPLDWARLTSSPSSNLRGLPPSTPYLRVPPSLLKQFTGRKGKDAWTVLGGKVYNITPYLPYHPGGEAELMKCAGRDGTRLFGEVHPWVNWEGMLEACMVGIAVGEGEVEGGGALEEMD
ncbi:hypothetical protein CJF31_00002599 [Rutstroemia sp. NJR-2017a BVV2]|nr:hypothetical protein CJF31_00002599 [Rutstroemia sp. NJR-2017a BVV2]